MKIFQTSDIHLGRRRINGKLPDSDLADAFAFIANKAIEAKADALLLVGDLFDKPQVEPPHLRQAQQILACLKEANIPVIAIEGNHDKMLLHSTTSTWIKYLADDGLLVLLRTAFDSDGACLTPWDPIKKTGSYLDLHGIRFVGTGYLGAATPYKMREIASKLESGRPHVLLLHAGPDYFVGEGGGFTTKDLCAIREKILYLALGHIHKPMIHKGWACNSGSPENCDLKEAVYDLNLYKNVTGRGYAIIDIDTQPIQPGVSIQICSNPRRKVCQLVLDCTKFGNMTKHGTTTLISSATKLIKSVNPEPSTVIDLKLKGKINFDRITVDQYALTEEIEKATNVIAVCIDSTELNLTDNIISNDNRNILSREILEKTTILQLLKNHDLFGIDGMEEEFASLFYELKEGIQSHWSIDEIAEHLDHNQLISHIISANAITD